MKEDVERWRVERRVEGWRDSVSGSKGSQLSEGKGTSEVGDTRDKRPGGAPCLQRSPVVA